jgi:glycosyltransferase involved in cell wall biosynthesis
MRVLILHSRYQSGAASGENQVVRDEAALLREGGHRVWMHAPTTRSVRRRDRAKAGASALWSASTAAAVARTVRTHDIDVVHVHNLFPNLSPAVLRAASAGGAAVVMTLHNYRLVCLPADLLRDGRVCEACVGRLPWRGVAYRCYRDSILGSATLAGSLALHRGIRSFEAVDRFLAVSPFVKAKHAEAGIPADRILVKPNFAWPVERREGPGDAFLYLGRLAPEKGVGTLLRAWALGAPGRLLVVGDGPEAAELRRTAPAGVDFLGQVPHVEVPPLLARARAILVPSRWYEAAPRGIVEAFAAGVPVIASSIGALREIVQDGVSGVLVPVDDASEWSTSAARLMDERTSVQLGEGAWRSWDRCYRPDVALGTLEDAYADALAAREARRLGAGGAA